MTILKLIPNLNLTLEPTALKHWTVQDYHRMSELGILDSNERTELIAGHITLMAAKGTAHVTSLHLLANAMRDLLGKTALVRTQDPIRLDNFSEPEPDLAVVRGTELDYADRHPRPEDLCLVVEVADSTLKQDCEIKDKLYAQAKIADYWVVDLKNRQLHVFRDPTPTGYTSHLILTEPHQVSPLAFPALTITLASILPPIS
jgi:Uma2 family endonuclease